MQKIVEEDDHCGQFHQRAVQFPAGVDSRDSAVALEYGDERQPRRSAWLEQVVQHKPKPAPKRESHAATRRKRVIPARRAHFGTTQTELTPPPLTIAQDKNQYHDNIPGGQA